ncbi:MAG: hypothetical protein LBL90_02955 [Prevotellaceae bacterium]|jgi:hypothetical protein|nr:hypothetical protein [Prevotellaceae bacterium]
MAFVAKKTFITNYAQIRRKSTEIVVNLPVEIKIEEEVQYYLIDNYKPLLATKKNFLKTFSKHKYEIENYTKDNKIDFLDINQLKQLFSYYLNI